MTPPADRLTPAEIARLQAEHEEFEEGCDVCALLAALMPERDCEADIAELVAQLQQVGDAYEPYRSGWNGANLSAGVRALKARVAELERERDEIAGAVGYLLTQINQALTPGAQTFAIYGDTVSDQYRFMPDGRVERRRTIIPANPDGTPAAREGAG